MEIELFKEKLYLHPYKAIYWERKSVLLIADLHLGKVKHFRKAGIAVPSDASNVNWDKLHSLLLDYQPNQVIFLGDLFHSTYNQAWEDLRHFIQQYLNVRFTLVLGNHDILPKELYESTQLSVETTLSMSPFVFTHEPLEAAHPNLYNLAGHIHPSVQLIGHGKQSMRLPCFFMGKNGGILPAFGAFTGMATITPKTSDSVYVVAEDQVIEMN